MEVEVLIKDIKIKDLYTEAETPILWPPHAKSWLIGKDFDTGRDWGQEEKGMTEDEKAGWHHRLDGHEFGWTLGVGDGQGGLVCCDSWDRKESDTTERLNWTGSDPSAEFRESPGDAIGKGKYCWDIDTGAIQFWGQRYCCWKASF